MALKGMEIGLVVIIMSILWAGVSAQSSCTNVIVSMSPCLNYITGNSSTPSSSCCSQLANVVKSQPKCLCEVLNGGGSSTGLNINRTQALALPDACSIQTPPISKCNAASPPASPAGTPNSPTTSAPGNGSKTTPSTDGDASAGTSTKLPFSLLFVLLFVASYTSNLSSF